LREDFEPAAGLLVERKMKAMVMAVKAVADVGGTA